MVAYSFNKIFAPTVEAGLKRQTVRGDRRRHAQIGEPVQLYTGMRTKACRKLVDPDPICRAVSPIRIYVPEPAETHRAPIVPGSKVIIEVAGGSLSFSEGYSFALADGFGSLRVKCRDGIWRGNDPDLPSDDHADALSLFGAWWWQDRGPGWWSGVVIEWRAWS